MKCPICIKPELQFSRPNFEAPWEVDCASCGAKGKLQGDYWVFDDRKSGTIQAEVLNETDYRNGEPLRDWEE